MQYIYIPIRNVQFTLVSEPKCTSNCLELISSRKPISFVMQLEIVGYEADKSAEGY